MPLTCTVLTSHNFVDLQKMRLRRIERGALTLASAEVKFQIDTETHDPLDIGMSGCHITFIDSFVNPWTQPYFCESSSTQIFKLKQSN